MSKIQPPNSNLHTSNVGLQPNQSVIEDKSKQNKYLVNITEVVNVQANVKGAGFTPGQMAPTSVNPDSLNELSQRFTQLVVETEELNQDSLNELPQLVTKLAVATEAASTPQEVASISKLYLLLMRILGEGQLTSSQQENEKSVQLRKLVETIGKQNISAAQLQVNQIQKELTKTLATMITNIGLNGIGAGLQVVGAMNSLKRTNNDIDTKTLGLGGISDKTAGHAAMLEHGLAKDDLVKYTDLKAKATEHLTALTTFPADNPTKITKAEAALTEATTKATKAQEIFDATKANRDKLCSPAEIAKYEIKTIAYDAKLNKAEPEYKSAYAAKEAAADGVKTATDGVKTADAALNKAIVGGNPKKINSATTKLEKAKIEQTTAESNLKRAEEKYNTVKTNLDADTKLKNTEFETEFKNDKTLNKGTSSAKYKKLEKRFSDKDQHSLDKYQAAKEAAASKYEERRHGVKTDAKTALENKVAAYAGSQKVKEEKLLKLIEKRKTLNHESPEYTAVCDEIDIIDMDLYVSPRSDAAKNSSAAKIELTKDKFALKTVDEHIENANKLLKQLTAKDQTFKAGKYTQRDKFHIITGGIKEVSKLLVDGIDKEEQDKIDEAKINLRAINENVTKLLELLEQVQKEAKNKIGQTTENFTSAAQQAVGVLRSMQS